MVTSYSAAEKDGSASRKTRMVTVAWADLGTMPLSVAATVSWKRTGVLSDHSCHGIILSFDIENQ
ncbi:hypothetical protein DPMN_036502 [Dreissena polymorpha]|uniref:Uncharacterized protein n=1 Tax=Dreissena polymorpha TaxID=45954 RepID=A0A9D4RLI3_DREPO|nr:hypothetical protein DPMN_036502 [Dreissena polymorpha]